MLARFYLVFALALTAACTNGGVANGDGNGNGTGTGGMTGGDGAGGGAGTGGDGAGGGAGAGGAGGGSGGGGTGGGGGGGGGGTTTPAPPVGPLKMPGLVMYWGQNGFGGANPGNAAKYEKDLGTTCTEHPEYDVVVLAFVTSFVRTRNADGYPEMNFANHCEAPWDARNPFLLKCPDIGAGIETCHSKGKRVLLSLGGASGSYGFVSDDEARAFAKTTWDMFLGGSSAIRPFAPATLDGVDLDLEGGSSTGYSAYVKALRTLMDASAARKYYIAAAPQCPFPDAYLGPAAGKALGDAPTAFDFLFVQFYNNFCAGTSPAAFSTAWNSWAGVAANGGPKIFVGLPATPQAANAASFVDRANLPSLLAGVKGASAFGGVMLWDVSFDQNSAATDGKTYGVAARALY